MGPFEVINLEYVSFRNYKSDPFVVIIGTSRNALKHRNALKQKCTKNLVKYSKNNLEMHQNHLEMH